MTSYQEFQQQLRDFLRFCIRAVSVHPWLFVGFVTAATAAALTEGLGIGLLTPLLQGATPGQAGNPQGSQNLFSALLPDQPGARIAMLAAVLTVVILMRGLLQIAASYLSVMLPLNLQTRLSLSVYDSLLKAPLEFFARSDGGIMRTLVQEYPQRIAGSIKSTADIIASAILAAVYVALMLWISWSMTLVSLVLVFTLGMLSKRILTVPLGRTGEALSVAQERWNTLIHETGLGLKLIRLQGAEQVMRRAYSDVVRSYVRHDSFRQLIAEAQSPLMTTVGGMFVCGLLFYGATRVPSFDTASLFVLVLCLYRLTVPVSRILSSFLIISSNLDALKRQEAFVTSTLAGQAPNGAVRFDHLERGIRFKGVSFCYPSSDRDALKYLDLTIGRGEMIALVGPSGAGKTSVVNLLGRLYDAQAGSIEIDDIDLNQYDIGSWRRRIAIVTQDITLFNMSVRDNLTFGLDGVSEADIVQAAERAAAYEFIDQLPQRWETKLGDRGVRLSGGQQQRLSIARAMLRDPELLILDEATSQVDTITERAIQQMIENYRGQRTILVVAHRLSTIRRADRIVVMKDGQSIELGSHDELAARNSHYRAMLQAQELDVLVDVAQ